MRHLVGLAACTFFALGGCASTGGTPAHNVEVTPETARTATTSTTAGSVGGLRVYKDPVTGQFVQPPPEQLPPASDVAAQSPTHFEEKASEVPGGGVSVDLQGQFRSYATATKGPDGKIKIECSEEHPEKR